MILPCTSCHRNGPKRGLFWYQCSCSQWVCDQIPSCFKVEVQESEGNTVIYEKE